MKTSAPSLRLDPSAETIPVGNLTIRFLVTAGDSLGSLAAFEMSVPGGGKLMGPAHSHDHYEETIYGLAGIITFTINGQPFDIGPGQALCIPRGAVHRFDNPRPDAPRALCVITPAAIGPEFFREVAATMAASAGGPPDKAKMMEIMRRHGLTAASA